MYTLKAIEDFVREEGPKEFRWAMLRHIEFVIDRIFTESETQEEFDSLYGNGPQGTGIEDYDLIIPLTILYKSYQYPGFIDTEKFKSTIKPFDAPYFPLFLGGATEERTSILKQRIIDNTPKIFEGLNIFIDSKELSNE